MIKRHALAFLLLLITVPAFSQVDFDYIEDQIEQNRIMMNVPGMAIAVVKDGKVVMSKGFGELEQYKGQAVDGNTLFAIASNTKAFIASAIGSLVDQGKLNWKDKVRDHLPYFELYDSYATAEATIEDLLCHRLGLGTFSGDAIWYKSELSAEEVVKRAKYVPQAYGFRDGYGYSNLMFITAGEVIKSVTGKEWHEYVKETFFAPLKMDRTITSTNDLEAQGNYAIPHKAIRLDNKVIDWVNWDNMGAAGGIISSVNDMAQWMLFQLHVAKGHTNGAISPETQNRIWTPHNNFVVSEAQKASRPGRRFNAYGLGWGISDYYGRRIIAHGGGYDGMYSRVALMPEENLGVVVLTNGMRGISPRVTDYIMNQYLKAAGEEVPNNMPGGGQNFSMYDRIDRIKTTRVENTKPSFKLSDYKGIFYTPMYGDIYIKEEGGKLRLEFSHAPLLSATLEHWHYDTYEIKWDQEHAWFSFGTVQFLMDAQRQISGMSIDVPNNDIFFDEFKLQKVNSPQLEQR